MRRFLLNTAVLGAVAGVIAPIRATAKGPRDWRLALVWAGWGISVTLAVLAVRDQMRADELEAIES